MYIIIISDEVESYDILAPEIIELCDPIQMEKFKKSIR